LPLNKQDYAAAKRDGELLIRQLGADGFNVIIARCFAFVGKYLPREQHFAIGNFIDDGLNKRSIRIKAKNLVYRSYMYADDLTIWLMTLANMANHSCDIFNVGSDERISIHELASKIANHFGQEVFIPSFNAVDEDSYVPSIQKALVAGCRPPRELGESIQLSAFHITQ
jgi:dTDP-glucose 4,6-dehydratase